MQDQVLPFTLKASKFVLSGLGKRFPDTTARLFFLMYCTPPKRKFRKSHLAAKAEARAKSVQMTSYPFDDTPIQIATYKWGESDKKLLLLHGWGGRMLDFIPTVENLVDHGYEVHGFDAPAHGYSEGKRTTLVQTIHILDQFIAQGPHYDAIIGHSMGGLIAAITLARKHVSCPKLVMAGSSVSAPSFFNDTYELFNIDGKVREKVAEIIRARLQDDLANFDLYNYIDKIKADKILFVYDKKDHLVKPAEVESFLKVYKSIESFAIEGEGHFKLLRDERVLEKIDRFISA